MNFEIKIEIKNDQLAFSGWKIRNLIAIPKKPDLKSLWYFVKQIIVKRDWHGDIGHDPTSKA